MGGNLKDHMCKIIKAPYYVLICYMLCQILTTASSVVSSQFFLMMSSIGDGVLYSELPWHLQANSLPMFAALMLLITMAAMAIPTPTRFPITLRMTWNTTSVSLCTSKHKNNKHNEQHTAHLSTLRSHRLSHTYTLWQLCVTALEPLPR